MNFKKVFKKAKIKLGQTLFKVFKIKANNR